jgi:hypothetical protein
MRSMNKISNYGKKRNRIVFCRGNRLGVIYPFDALFIGIRAFSNKRIDD